MLGTVVSYNEQIGRGIVESLDGESYQFDYQDIADSCIPYKGMAAYFELTDDSKKAGRATSLVKTLPRFNWSSMAVFALALAFSACAYQGPSGAQGSPGLNGHDGSPGQDGNAGQNGQNGADGKDGIDATPVTVVQLCPGSTSYPSTFVEVAFCVGGRLYGTYSANGGFSTELVPGTYSSNAIGSSCNLTVEANCVVTH